MNLRIYYLKTRKDVCIDKSFSSGCR